jgi:2'-5' RNA ligase
MFASPIDTFRRPPMLSTHRLQRRHSPSWPPWGRATDRLFLAALPDDETASRIADLARRLRIGHGLAGKPLDPERLHVTLFHIGDSVGLCRDTVDAAMERAATVAMPAFKVAFDRVMSFRNGALVLCGEESTIGLEILQQRLSDGFDARPMPARPFTPHVTLLRDSHRVEDHDIEPIAWTVREIVLVHSLLGQTTHRPLARLPLH